MTEVLLTLVCSPELELALGDWLLEQEKLPGFTSIKVAGHGSKDKMLSLVEQVEGRKKQLMFQVHIPQDAMEPTIEDLKKEFGGAHIHYWLTPIIATGRLDE